MVGVGASACGLESLERLFDPIPADCGMAFVVVQHLSPDFRSMMDELLARHTGLRIRRAEDGMPVEPNHLYLLPPKMEMIIAEGRLRLTEKDAKQGFTLPIDRFFRSLARDCGPRSAAIVLSGTGSDGSRGILEVAAAGGLVLSETPETAKFDGMPVSAQETGVVDFVLPPEQMGSVLLRQAGGVPLIPGMNGADPQAPPLEGLEAVFDLLRRDYDIDFSHYKPTTVSRRIERRLSLAQLPGLEHYVDFLRHDPEELNALYKDLLIGVTSFFRDPEPFEQLEAEVIPGILERVGRNEEIRVWVAGCATGEEAYSLAIVFIEALERAKRPVNLKILATDVHRASLDSAAQGRFDESRLSAVSPQRLRRFFTRRGEDCQVSQELRQVVVFAPHNVIKDAPFTSLDLISCRNLLIYFNPPAQKRALSLFHFGLKPGGVLMLGSSESPGDLAEEFDTIDEQWRRYRKRGDTVLALRDTAQRLFAAQSQHVEPGTDPAPAAVPRRPALSGSPPATPVRSAW